MLRSPPHSPTLSRRSGGGRVFVGYNWTNFKVLANLSKKSDQAITEYYNSFLTMCHRVCNEPLPEGKLLSTSPISLLMCEKRRLMKSI